MKIRSTYPVTIRIDDPETGEFTDVKIRVKRFDLDEWSRFTNGFNRAGNPRSKTLLARKPSGEEQEQVEKDLGTPEKPNVKKVYVIDDETIMKRRLAEMSSEEKAHYDEVFAADEQFSLNFLRQTITDFVTVPQGQITEVVSKVVNDEVVDEEIPVTTGTQMLRIFGGREDILGALLQAVRMENTLNEPLKKALRLASAFARSSAKSQKAADGPTLEPTAPSAVSEGSAPSEAAPAASNVIPFGSAE